jgi:MoaA/NifB/PqqE/SkfB family radical SAM enzyme
MSASNALPAAYRLSDAEHQQTHVGALPRCVFIEVTNHCNLSCPACVRTFQRQEAPKSLTLDAFVALVEQFPGMERAVLHGIGEPLLHPQLTTMIRHLKARGVYVLFNSNATLLTPDLQEALVHSELDEYRISLDSAHAERYARLRGRPLYERVVENLRGLAATKERLGSALPRTSIWCIGMKENIGELPDLVRLAAELAVPEVYVQRLVYPLQRDGRSDAPGPQQALFGHLRPAEREIIAECTRLSAELGIAFRASGATDPADSLSAEGNPREQPWLACRRPWTTAYITANGNALPCCIAPFATANYRELILGNVWRTGFAEIWNNNAYRAWRAALLGPHPPEPCGGCGVHWSL